VLNKRASTGQRKAKTASAQRSPRERGATGAAALEQLLVEAEQQQAATAEILRVIQSSRGDAQPVFDTIAGAALRLCAATDAVVFRFDGELLHVAALASANRDRGNALRQAFPRPPSRETAAARAVLTRKVVVIPDVLLDPEYAITGAALAAGFRSAVSVPLLRDGAPIGAIGIGRTEAAPFSDKQIALLQTFADQALIAIENARLFTELKARNHDLFESLEQQTATSEILRVINRSPTDVRPVFDTIVANAVRLCGADHGIVGRFDGKCMLPVAHCGFAPEALTILLGKFPLRPAMDTLLARVALKRAVDNLPDMLADPDYDKGYARAGGWRSGLAVPMMRDGELIGAIAVSRKEPGAFPERLVKLLQTFADQAVIAIENMRLFTALEARNRDLHVALEQQTATSELLKVIGRSAFELQPVFETLVENAVRLCEAERGLIFRFDGELLRVAVTQNVSPELRAFFEANPIRLGRNTNSGRAALERRTVHNHDVLADPEYTYGGARVDPYRTVLAVPMLKGNEVLGVIAIYRHEVRPFSDDQVALIETFADQAVIAIENVRLFSALEARNRDLTEALERQTATSEILRVISQSPRDVQPVFDTIAAAALRLCSASSANVFTFDGTLVHLAALVNLTPEGADVIRSLWPRPPSRDLAATRAILTCGVVAIPDVVADPEFAASAAAVAGNFRSILSVPLTRDGKPIGAIAVGRPEAGPFPDSQIALLQTFADQAVIAIENVRLFTELEARTRELTRSVSELEALGEVGQAVSSTLDLETVLRTIVSRATHLAGMSGGSIWEYDETSEAFHLHATDRLPGELVEALRAAPIRKGEGALGRMAVTGEPVEIRDIADERTYPSRLREALVRSGLRAVLAVPLLREDHLLGALAVNRSTPGDFAPAVTALLKTFATQSALAIQNARLYREIEVKSRELEVASRHKSEFLANMSHELRTPLNAIIGFSEVLSERMFGELNAKQLEYVGDILESGRHLLSLINDILDLSKIEAGRMELEPSEFDLPAAIESTLVLVRERAGRRTIAVAHDVDARLGVVRADERKVKQVLLNLLSNALKFTPEGGRIDVRAALRDGVAEIAVADTGVGIALDDQAAVFEEFRQVGTAAKKVEGTGLGLAISRKFVELHGGRIWLESRPGAGATFTFTLPVR
jgi:GAF domain-containing protein